MPTLRISLSSKGPTSVAAFAGAELPVFRRTAALLSISTRVLTQDSSIGPSDILCTTTGEMLSSSTIGARPFSTACLLATLTLSAVDLLCNVSMSAETAARSFLKLVRFVSTALRTSSQARIDRCKSSSFVLSRSSVHWLPN
jgi:hypothetical protein